LSAGSGGEPMEQTLAAVSERPEPSELQIGGS
jgi:hypothetical protein